MSSRRKIAICVHENFVRGLLDNGVSLEDPLSLAAESAWKSRPNSTTRLTLANVRALKQLETKHDLTFYTQTELTDELFEELGGFDIVVVNSIASVTSINFTISILERRRVSPKFKAKIVVGTEATWSAALKRGEITQEQYNSVYFGDCLLRHTARTDREIYAGEQSTSATIQEFELAVDPDFFVDTPERSDRRAITFVKAPEGRKTKNNEGIGEILDALEGTKVLDTFEIQELAPPYSLMDYWEALSKSAFLLFTSLGETFSYAMNDAKFLGVVTFFPEQMYFTTIGRRFTVDAYPELGLKYHDASDVRDQLLDFVKNPIRWEEESRKSIATASSKFGFETVKGNWDKLFTGICLNTEGILLYSDGDFESRENLLECAKAHNCNFVMEVLPNVEPGVRKHVTRFDSENDIRDIEYYLGRDDSGQLRRLIEIEDGQVVGRSTPTAARENEKETLTFMQLVSRSYKISRIRLTRSLEDSVVAAATSNVTYFETIDTGLKNVEVAWV